MRFPVHHKLNKLSAAPDPAVQEQRDRAIFVALATWSFYLFFKGRATKMCFVCQNTQAVEYLLATSAVSGIFDVLFGHSSFGSFS